MSKKTLIIVLGPTAVGKTKFAIELANHYNTEIISCDSRQFYRELNIGVARPSKDELQAAKHHLIGHISVENNYNVSKFEIDALDICNDIFVKSDYAVMVGGSGMYIDTICNGIAELPDVEPSLRNELKQKFETEGLEGIRNMLKMLDPDYYEIVDLANPARILRALEVVLTTGKPYSTLRVHQKKERPFEIIKIGLSMEREVLYRRIDERVDIMLKDGLLAEAEAMKPYKENTALKTVGYTELFKYFDEEWDLSLAVEKIKTNTRRYAKRQFTWFNRYQDIQWFTPFQLTEVINYIKEQE